MSDQPVARPLPTQDNTESQRQNIHASNGIQTHGPSNEAAKTYAAWPPGSALNGLARGKCCRNLSSHI
jgi:hypothetical protein